LESPAADPELLESGRNSRLEIGRGLFPEAEVLHEDGAVVEGELRESPGGTGIRFRLGLFRAEAGEGGVADDDVESLQMNGGKGAIVDEIGEVVEAEIDAAG